MTNIATGTTTATTALVPVFTGTIQGQTIQLCDARTLHTFMGVLRDFSNWIKARIRKFGFVEGVDYLLAAGEVVAQKGENLGGRPTVDYHLTLDMAKELSMVENNDKGREARRYFMACEKQVIAALSTGYAIPHVITPAQAQHLRELVQLVVESGKQGHGETWARLHRKLKVNSYLALHPDQFDAACKYLRTKMDDASIAAIAQKHFPQIAQLSAPQHEEPKMPFDITSACAFILGGMFDPRAVAALADACGRVLFRVAVNSDQGPGREIANKIKTLGAADLYAVHVAVAMEAHLRTSPQRVAT